jgi:hypothetical protein
MDDRAKELPPLSPFVCVDESRDIGSPALHQGFPGAPRRVTGPEDGHAFHHLTQSPFQRRTLGTESDKRVLQLLPLSSSLLQRIVLLPQRRIQRHDFASARRNEVLMAPLVLGELNE